MVHNHYCRSHLIKIMILYLPYPSYLFSLIPLPLRPSSIDPLPSFPSSLFSHFSPSLLYLILVPDFSLSISFNHPLSLSTHISLSLHSSSHRVHRVVTSAFWRTFSHEGKIRLGWLGWGVHAHPFSLHLPSPVKLQCTLQLSGQIH
jgi:hypothetical protein